MDHSKEEAVQKSLTSRGHSNSGRPSLRSVSPIPDVFHFVGQSIKDYFLGTGPSSLHNPSSIRSLIQDLQQPDVDANELDVNGDAPLHAIVKRRCANKREQEEKLELLVSLLTYSDADVNLQVGNDMTALHFAAEACDLYSAKVLVSFGAKVNTRNGLQKAPLDLVEGPQRYFSRQDSTPPIPFSPVPKTPKSSTMYGQFSFDKCTSANVVELRPPAQDSTYSSESIATVTEYVSLEDVQEMAKFLKSVGGARARGRERTPSIVRPFLKVHSEKGSEEISHDATGVACDTWTSQLAAQYSELEASVELKLADVSIHPADLTEAGPLVEKLKTLRIYRMAGSRILSLDGGGMRGLVEIEILSQIEEATGRKITELFDWIVGTSAGGILALAMVYGGKTLHQLRQLFFRMKDEIFAKGLIPGTGYDTIALEKLLQEELGANTHMSDVRYPRVLIAAVDKSSINPKLHFFNNCFGDDYSKQLVWKVARYTSAAPTFFNELDNYVDGGVLANNPCAKGLTKLQNFYKYERKQKLPISLVVSVGSGKNPDEKLGNVDAHDSFKILFRQLGFSESMSRASNLVLLLSAALVESETVAEDCQCRCREQGILFYRFSPQLGEVTEPGETDSIKLLDMILAARKQIPNQDNFSALIVRFHRLSDISKELHERIQK